MVRTLRLALPAFAIGILGIYGLTTWRLTTLRARGVTLENVHVSNDHLMMANPKYAGAGKDGSRHAVRARSAETDLVSQKLVKLTTIEGEIVQLNGTKIDLTATRGTYDQETGVLQLQEQIDVKSSDGMVAKLTSATVLTKENRIVTNEPITATSTSGTIRARAMEMATKRRLATFTGDVAVRMTPPQQPANAAPKKEKEKSASTALGPSFSSNEPVDITSDRLTVDDEKRTAMFRTNVVARQGTATLLAPELDAVYAGRSALPGAAADPGTDPAASRLTSLEARGGIVMTRDTDRATATTLHYDAESQRTILTGPVDMSSGIDRRATSATAEIDHKSDRITLDGAVVLYQAKNILRGERLAIDRASGRARLDSPPEAARGNGRINVILYRPENATSRTRQSSAAANESEGGSIGSFRTDPSAPIDIDAASLDFDENKRNALFTGSVVAKQGDFVIRTPSLMALFQGQTSLLSAVPKSADGSTPTSLKKIEARNGVVITGKDGQKVTGDWADFDPVGNFATVGGQVVVSQGKNVVEGTKLIMDLTSGRTRFETGGANVASGPASESTLPCAPGQTCTSKRRVRAIFYPKDAKRPPAVRDRGTSKQAPAPTENPSISPAQRSPSQSSWQSSTTRTPAPEASQ